MDFNEYQKSAMATKKVYPNQKEQIINALLGMSGEVGEVHEMFKKHYAFGREIVVDDLIKEIGDILWYLAEMCDAFGFSLEECAKGNIAKLRARHGDKFTGYGDRSGEGK